MILRYRVSLPDIKGFVRVYEVKSSMTLYDFHKIMRDEMDFPHDQQIQFKALDANGGLVARYAMFDLGFGTVDEVTLGAIYKKAVASFIYFYDVTNKKSVIVTCEGEVEQKPRLVYPALVETKGPSPIDFENGYVAYEDLPDEQKHIHSGSDWRKDDENDEEEFDIEDDEDDEEEDDEDGQEIYDENEGM